MLEHSAVAALAEGQQQDFLAGDMSEIVEESHHSLIDEGEVIEVRPSPQEQQIEGIGRDEVGHAGKQAIGRYTAADHSSATMY